ncbi:signal recognition particle receptor subunit alpha, partial [Pseudanabaenaceae cyanobacterium LEGE 13415]|nr:signal recognition particle receptor subunit alpha [Pseudanabaenaceae cyanobacterium LEGE 13415]
MTFNWFNRFNKEEEKQPEPTPTVETPAEETSAEETTSEEDARIANARAIVEAFRRKQREQAEPSTEVSETVEASEPAETSEVAPVTAEVAEPVETEVPIEAEASPEVAESIETSSEIPESVETTEPEQSDPQPAIPFWAQSQAETQARLERLRASAIEEETEPEPVAEAPQFEPAFTIDEGFLWSAEVLSAMGRRAEDVSIEEITWLKRLRKGLDKTRRSLVNQLKAIVGQGPLNQDAVYEIESLLLQADAGVEATDKIIEALQAKLRQETLPPDQAIAYLKQILRDLLDQPLQGSHSAFFAPEKDTLNIWLMTGVNGAGKTTTLGKLAHIATKSGYKCLIGA